MKVASLQLDVRLGDKKRNIDKIEQLISKPVDIVVLPELFSTGYFHKNFNELMRLSENIPDGYTTQELHRIAKKKDCYLIGAIIENDLDSLFITAVVVGPEGFVGKQRKIHLTDDEKEFYSRGENSEIFDIRGCKVGVIICFEGWFPESSRKLMVKGAQVICHSLLTCQEKSLDIIRVRAMENKTYFIVSNSISTEYKDGVPIKFRGDSRIIDYDGNILINANNEEAMIFTEIDEKAVEIKSLEDCKDLINEVAF